MYHNALPQSPIKWDTRRSNLKPSVYRKQRKMYLKTRYRASILSFLVGKYSFLFVRKIPNTRFYQNTSTIPNTSQNRPDIRRFWRNTIPKMVYQVGIPRKSQHLFGTL